MLQMSYNYRDFPVIFTEKFSPYSIILYKRENIVIS